MRKRYKPSLFNRITLGVAVLTAVFMLGKAAASQKLEEPYYTLGQSVVKILNMGGTGGGTGFMVRTKNHKKGILTNWHVCSAADANKQMRAIQEGSFDLIVKVVAMAPEVDLCLLTPVPLPLVPLAPVGPSRFDAVYTVGHPLLKPQSPAMGRYTAEVRDTIGFSTEADGSCLEGFKFSFNPWQGPLCLRELTLSDTTVPIFPGNSGSPAVNADGELIGVVNSSLATTGYGGLIPLRFVKAFLEAN